MGVAVKTKHIVAPPVPPMATGSLKDILKFLTDDYKHKYDIWNRTGGFNSNIVLKTASVDTTAISNVDATENDLIQYTLKANSLSEDGDFAEIDAFGEFAANANNKRLRLYFGTSVVLDTSSVAANSGSWIIQSKVIRVSSSSQKVITTIISSNSLVINKSEYGLAAEDLAQDIIVKCTALAVSADDITQEGLTIKLFEQST